MPKSAQGLVPPPHLSARARGLWADIVPRRGRSPERLVLLAHALEQLDRADAAREAIAREGLTLKAKRSGAVKAHPALRIEAAARREFFKLWKELHLDWDVELDGLVD